MIRLIVLGQQLRQYPHLVWALLWRRPMVSAGSYSAKVRLKSRFYSLGMKLTYIQKIFNNFKIFKLILVN